MFLVFICVTTDFRCWSWMSSCVILSVLIENYQMNSLTQAATLRHVCFSADLRSDLSFAYVPDEMSAEKERGGWKKKKLSLQI